MNGTLEGLTFEWLAKKLKLDSNLCSDLRIIADPGYRYSEETFDYLTCEFYWKYDGEDKYYDAGETGLCELMNSLYDTV